ncbi:hypothetical protein [Petropleomorpha daqingensis]|uniref:Uncharacterized protein n=1 Tax=Petropleomorpha daqingensis TaxID=2026353 RepID=A0A853CHD2_9ACTN|nr:hypothetical protein [Petropleomorpha daqingensis]NYJ06581.1 hypothetical protein [Petropleomorpha daqingensis]
MIPLADAAQGSSRRWTQSLATGNLIAQGASGLFGFAANLFVDVAAIPFYAQLWSEVRGIYGKGEITQGAAKAYLKPNVGFLVQDLVWDKIVGSIPIIGVPFNVVFAKALSWRLRAWFGFLSAIDGEDDDQALTEATMQLVREVFPDNRSIFDFAAPDRDVFVEFIASVDGLTTDEVHDRTKAAVDALRGR